MTGILDQIVDFYIGSEDFNGVPIIVLKNRNRLTLCELLNHVRDLIAGGDIAVYFGDRHPNPHVRAYLPETPKEQLAKLDELDEDSACYACCYPEPRVLESRVNLADYEGKPFTLRIALGEPTLQFVPFDLSVLECYRNDPRYSYETNDVGGRICITDEHEQSHQLRDSDKIFLQTFGFCYDDDFNRAVAVYNRYLSQLSAEHQQIWSAKSLCGNYVLHPDYARITAGHWAEKLSLFDAFLMELQHINQMCELIGKPPLFRQSPRDTERPRNFAFLLRPTVKEYQDFVGVLDKLMSDNLNKKFFQLDVNLEEEIERKDGRVEVRHKGTIALLDEWISLKFKPKDPKPIAAMISTFREVRRLRQRPAHALDDNRFDQSIFHEQRSLVQRSYGAVRTIRLILANHPRAIGYEVPEALYNGEIWPF